jgi:hypothetical protein
VIGLCICVAVGTAVVSTDGMSSSMRRVAQGRYLLTWDWNLDTPHGGGQVRCNNVAKKTVAAQALIAEGGK